MRVFQNAGLYKNYKHRLGTLTHSANSFRQQLEIFLNDRYGNSHLLRPIFKNNESYFFTNGDDFSLQRAWAVENGLKNLRSLEEILHAQIEDHRTEIFYNLDPVRYGANFIRRLPGSVKKTIAWRAAPSGKADFSGYDLIVSNFPEMTRLYRKFGCKTAYFFPSHDPVLDNYSNNRVRPIDVLFIGGYSRHHKERAKILEKVAMLSSSRVVSYHLDKSRQTMLAESWVGRCLPLANSRRASNIKSISKRPVFGLELYQAMSESKVIINSAIDSAFHERGNMRCFESMGAGCLLVSDRGHYPKGMTPGSNMLTYSSANDAVSSIETALDNWDVYSDMASRGNIMVRDVYSKARQWQRFNELVGEL